MKKIRNRIKFKKTKNKQKRNTEIRLVTPVNRWYDNNTTDKKHE